MEIEIKNLDHLGIVAGVIDEIGIVSIIDEAIGSHTGQIVTTGTVVKAMILNGLGFVSAPLYMFEKFYEGKALEHLLGEGITAKQLNDDRLGRGLDALWEAGISQLFTQIAMKCYERFCLKGGSIHLDSTSISVEGEYQEEGEGSIKITHGYSRDKRPDLKQFMVDIICSSDGDVPLFLRVGNGNESDKAEFGNLLTKFQQEWDLDSVYVADSALYSQDNIAKLSAINWITRVPANIKAVNELLNSVPKECFVESNLKGYSFAECCSNYGGTEQRWLLVESAERKSSDLKKWEKVLEKHRETAQKELTQLCQQEFFCEADAYEAIKSIGKGWRFHQPATVKVIPISHHQKPGRPKKNLIPHHITYRMQADLTDNLPAIHHKIQSFGKWVLATNVIDDQKITNEELLATYKSQQSCERGFRFLKDPLFFTASVFLKTPSRIAALAMVMGLCLMVYTLAQRQLRHNLRDQNGTIANQLGKPTAVPTLRWVFQCLQAIHWVLSGAQLKIILSKEQSHILRFFGTATQKYYFLC